MTKYIGPLTRIVVFVLTIMFQLGFIQSRLDGPHPWINLPLLLLLWSALQRSSPWPLIAAGIVGIFLDISNSEPFGLFILAQVFATLTVMIISVEWLNRRGTGNRVVIGMMGLGVYGLSWFLVNRTASPAPHFFSFDLVWEVCLLWLAFTLFRLARPLWISLTKPVKRYA